MGLQDSTSTDDQDNQTVVEVPEPCDIFELVSGTRADPILAYTGQNRSALAAETDATWRVGRIAKSGIKTSTLYKSNGTFDQKFSERKDEGFFPEIQFANIFSVQFDDQANSYATVPDASNLDFANTAAFSMGMWFKTNKTGAQTLIQKTSSAGGNNGYTLIVDGSARPEFEFRATGTGDREKVRANSPTVTLQDGIWHLIVVTRASGSGASSFKIYLDGNSETLTTLNDTLTGTTTNSDQLVLAAAYNGGTPRFQGNVDEPAVWSAELTGAEVTEIYNSDSGVIDLSDGTGQISSALVSWWRMGDNDSHPTITDNSGSNDMTLASAVPAGNIESESPP